MKAPFSRRALLAVGIATALVSSAVAAPIPKGADDKSWVGKTVLPKKPDPVTVVFLPKGPKGFERGELFHHLHAASWEVKAEKGSRVQVIEDGAACWVEKDLLVPLAEAVEFHTKALKDNPKAIYAYNFRGWAKYLLGKPEEAVKDFDEFLRQKPTAADPIAASQQRQAGLSNRGLVLAEMGKFDAAIKDLDEAVKLGHVPAQLNRGWAYELKGDYKKAVADYEAILNLRPADVPALNNLAWLRATCPDAALRDGSEAVKLAKRACDLSDNREGMYLDTLAAAHAEAGDFAAAVRAQERALEDRGYMRKQGEDAQKRLRLYQQKKSYRSKPLSR